MQRYTIMISHHLKTSGLTNKSPGNALREAVTAHTIVWLIGHRIIVTRSIFANYVSKCARLYTLCSHRGSGIYLTLKTIVCPIKTVRRYNIFLDKLQNIRMGTPCLS